MRLPPKWQDRLDHLIAAQIAARLCPGTRRCIRGLLALGLRPETIARKAELLGPVAGWRVGAYLRYLGEKE